MPCIAICHDRERASNHSWLLRVGRLLNNSSFFSSATANADDVLSPVWLLKC